MKKLNIFLLLSTIFTGHLISMEVSEDKQEAPIFNLLDEIILDIIEREARETINNWNDVFEEAPNVDISLFKGLAKTCKKFAALYQSSLVYLNNFKNNKFKRLLENLKSEFLEANKNISPEELNNRLANLLNNFSDFLNFEDKLKDVVKLILAGADVNIQDNDLEQTALVWATKKGHKEIMKILINAKANVNIQDKFGNTALIIAVTNGRKELIEMLIKAEADINIQNKYGNTALMCATVNGSKNIVEMLINSGADINIQNKYGKTALIRAAILDNKELVEMLIRAGADVNFKDNDGNTALMCAAGNGSKNIVEMLINSDSDVNIQNKYGGTALRCATVNDHRELVEMLINASVDINAQDGYGWTVLDWATMKGHEEIAAMLLRAGSNINIEVEGETNTVNKRKRLN